MGQSFCLRACISFCSDGFITPIALSYQGKSFRTSEFIDGTKWGGAFLSSLHPFSQKCAHAIDDVRSCK